jgi:hypothetical protein
VGGALPAAEGAAGVSGAAVEDLARALHLKSSHPTSPRTGSRPNLALAQRP